MEFHTKDQNISHLTPHILSIASNKTSNECQENVQPSILNLKRLYFSATKIPIDQVLDAQVFSDVIVSSPLLDQYKIRKQFQASILKRIITKFEKCGEFVPDEIYDKLGSLMGEKDEEYVERVYFNKNGDQVLFSIEESVNQLSKGTTGLSIWQASCDLANLCQYLPLENKTIIELGAGCGLSGISISANFPSSTVYLTDYNDDVLQILEKNVKKNNLKNCECRSIDWCNFDSKEWLNSNPDLLIAADVVYDTELLPSLCRTISWFLETFPKSCALIACTLRNPESLKCFEKNILKFNMEIVEKISFENSIFDIGDGIEVLTTFPFSSTIQTPTIFYSLGLVR